MYKCISAQLSVTLIQSDNYRERTFQIVNHTDIWYTSSAKNIFRNNKNYGDGEQVSGCQWLCNIYNFINT